MQEHFRFALRTFDEARSDPAGEAPRDWLREAAGEAFLRCGSAALAGAEHARKHEAVKTPAASNAREVDENEDWSQTDCAVTDRRAWR